MELTDILAQLGFDPNVQTIQATPFKSDEDGSEYAVWKVTADGQSYVLKEAKECELEIYTTFLRHPNDSAPRLYAVTHHQDKAYLLMEYIPGESLRICSRLKLVMSLDALIALQDFYWEKHEYDSAGHNFEKSLSGRINRGKYLDDAELERAYEVYLELYSKLPRTLCHDDLLPFNVLASDRKAVIIDWELAGMLPYPTALARLLAHGAEDEHAFFYMTDSDKAFAIDYYYGHFVRAKGIPYADYRSALDYFFLYEYCEWIMLGVKYGNTESQRYLQYRSLAKQLISKLNTN